jgi:hypothetical protein
MHNPEGTESETAAATEKRRGDSVAGEEWRPLVASAGGDFARKGGGVARPAEKWPGRPAERRRAATGREAAQSAEVSER